MPPRPLDPRVAKLLAYDDIDPLADLESADAIATPSAPPVLQPGGRCTAVGEAQRLTTGPMRAAVAAVGDGFVVAGYEVLPAGPGAPAREQLRVLSLPPRGLPRPLRTIPLEHAYPRSRPAPPGLHAADDDHVTLAAVDGRGRLLVAELAMGRGAAAPKLRELATGVDARFAPAVAHVDKGALIAWTVGSTPMATHYVLLPADAKQPFHADLTPPRQGASAATFVDGASPPVLVAVDARDGMSPMIVMPFDDKGMPGRSRPAGPVGMVSTPTQLSAARADFATLLGYTGLGAAASSAIGVLAIDHAGASPEALVRGDAYGPLHVSAASAGDHVLVAADAPLRPGKDPPHALRIYRIDRKVRSELGNLQAEGGDLSQASLARTRSGLLAVVYAAAGASYASRVRCE